MAVNFRLEYNSGTNIVDLFPQTSLDAINISQNILSYSTIAVSIPAPTSANLTQTVPITTTDIQINSPVYMILVSSGTQAQSDYATITQYQVLENQLILTRLYNQPTGNIDVVLIFQEANT